MYQTNLSKETETFSIVIGREAELVIVTDSKIELDLEEPIKLAYFQAAPLSDRERDGKEGIIVGLAKTDNDWNYTMKVDQGSGDKSWWDWESRRPDPNDPESFGFAVAMSNGGGQWEEVTIVPKKGSLSKQEKELKERIQRIQNFYEGGEMAN